MEQYEKMYLYKRVVQAKLFIDKHFSENIDVANIAGEAFFSKYHFIRLFKSIYGKTPHYYLTQVRMSKAQLLLTEGKTILDVCVLIGFDSPTSFTAIFKKTTGKTPSTFQNQQKLRQQAINNNPLSVVPNCFAETHSLLKK